MEVFTYHPRTSGETLTQFNQRVRDYCGDTLVVAVLGSAGKTGITLSLTTADDVIASPAVLTAELVELPLAPAPDVENSLGEALARLKDESTEAEPKIPAEVHILSHADYNDFALIKVIRGVLDTPQ